MYIHGEFLNRHSETVAVHIVTGGDRTTEKVVGEAASGLYFTDDPVEISSEVRDTFDVLLTQSATVRMLTREYLPDLFCTSCRDAVVNIYKGGECVFAGYVQPQTYSQSYNEQYDELEINCIDALSALEYSNYKDVGQSSVDYASVKAAVQNRSFYDLITELLDGITCGLCLQGETCSYYYDGTKGLTSYGVATGLKDIGVSDALFLEDEEDSVWTCEEVLEEILKYLNLHIRQVGMKFYIFDWATVKSSASITWYDLSGVQADITAAQEESITVGKVADVDTSISINEVYNRLELTCTMDDVENIVESPMDEDLVEPVFNHKMLYMKEYSSEGYGKTSTNAMYYMLHGLESETTYEKAVITDWYLRVKKNDLWSFRYNDNEDMLSHFYPNGLESGHQEAAPNYMNKSTRPICAMLMSIGCLKRNMAKKDNAPASSVDMEDYLVVSVNGNGDTSESGTYPQASDIRAAIPIASYMGGANVNLTPADGNTTNYIVISGKVILSRSQSYAPFPVVYEMSQSLLKYAFLNNGGGVESVNNGEGRFLTRLFYTVGTDGSEETAQKDLSDRLGVAPYDSEEQIPKLEFKYSAVGDGTDTLSKVPVLQCMLIIGDYCAVEDMEMDGSLHAITWQKYKTLEECADEDEYYQQSFSIGFNPAIGDNILGKEYDIQNNIVHTMNIDAEGMAIPIEYSNRVNGQVQFKILGPVNALWDDITRRHPTFFRHTKWTTNTVPLLAETENIFIKDFEIKVYSDNGKLNTESTDNDVVYMSDTDEKYVNKKSDLEFSICSALTAAECEAMGVSTGVKKCTAVDMSSGDGVLKIYDTHNAASAKAEQLYVDAYWQEWHAPKVVMEQNFEDVNNVVSEFALYTHPAMGKTFFVEGISRNLIEGTARLTIKEV